MNTVIDQLYALEPHLNGEVKLNERTWMYSVEKTYQRTTDQLAERDFLKDLMDEEVEQDAAMLMAHGIKYKKKGGPLSWKLVVII